MQIFVLFWIALCLVADTSTKSVPSTDHETGTADLSVPLHANADGNQTVEECKCKDGFCEKNDRGQLVCKCPPEWGLDTPTSCKRCDCGKDSNCTFSGFFSTTKKCLCKVGYKEFNGTCEGDCSQNPCKNGGTCLVTRGEVTCQCKDGFAGEDCSIEACKCKDGFCEKNDRGQLVCKCPPEWGLDTPTSCKKCDCGKDSNCTFSEIFTKVKTCLCKDGYKEFDGICKACSCGTNTMACEFDARGNKLCSCPEGYLDINGQCHKIPFPSTVGPVVSPSNTTSSMDPISDFTTLNVTSVPPTTTARPTVKEFDAYVIIIVAASVLSAVALIFVTCVLCQRNRRRT